jgi:signal transduction histidine kinase
VQQLGTLLREVFDPREVARSQRTASRVRVAADGSTLVVPVPQLSGQPSGTLVLRYAQQGRRLFTQADGQLCERLLEQLGRAVAYDRAVEHGRAEERARIAQDLHDDIGARLLTLMYKAQDQEMEEYLRHTLQDLKTLTRGLAVAEHRLGPAAAEWKADLTQRLAAAQAQLGWACHGDEALVLTVVQWSALTRVLRELVTNALYHGRSRRVDVVIELSGAALSLSVADDGRGREPAAWAHGLGLGGVRKRVKQLGGSVAWLENGDRGIVCRVHIPQFREGA